MQHARWLVPGLAVCGVASWVNCPTLVLFDLGVPSHGHGAFIAIKYPPFSHGIPGGLHSLLAVDVAKSIGSA